MYTTKSKVDEIKEKIEKQLKEIDELKQNKNQLPQNIYDWMQANCLDESLKRDPKYLAYALRVQKQINKITSDPILFCAADPEPMIRGL